MPISSISGAAAPVKTETSEAQLSSDTARTQSKPAERAVRTTEPVDEKVTARVAADQKQVSQPEQSDSGGETDHSPRRPKVSNEIQYAVTQQKLSESSGRSSGSENTSKRPVASDQPSDESRKSDELSRKASTQEADNRQSRANSSQEVSSRPSKAEF